MINTEMKETTGRGGGVDSVRLEIPAVADGAAMWRLASECGTLDLNSSYFYLLWCRDFARTSLVARSGSAELVGFVAGFARPACPETLFVWQVGVAGGHRRTGLASRMLDCLVERQEECLGVPVRHVEASVTPDNLPSSVLFGSFAQRHAGRLVRGPLFDATGFPDAHAPEELIRIDVAGPATADRGPGGSPDE
jgi:L-2,4-diaminobutyric acid acetyltransferase